MLNLKKKCVPLRKQLLQLFDGVKYYNALMHDFYRVPGNVLIFSSGSFPKFSWYLEDFWSLLSFLILSLPGFYLFLTRSLLYFYFNNSSPECSSGLIVFLLSPAAQRETSEDCRSCLECSRDNGCVRCPERLFLFLQREGISHHGTCLHACPAGHYGQRGKDVNRCMSAFCFFTFPCRDLWLWSLTKYLLIVLLTLARMT